MRILTIYQIPFVFVFVFVCFLFLPVKNDLNLVVLKKDSFVFLVEDQVKSQGLHATTHNQLDSDKKTSPQQNSKQESGSKNNILLMLVGLPGSGKSTFCKRLLGIHASKWKRVCQVCLFLAHVLLNVYNR